MARLEVQGQFVKIFQLTFPSYVQSFMSLKQVLDKICKSQISQTKHFSQKNQIDLPYTPLRLKVYTKFQFSRTSLS